jgi:putative ABC transport system permease protein
LPSLPLPAQRLSITQERPVTRPSTNRAEGVLAFSVSGRTREFGIRLALGAQLRSILAGVLVEGLVIASLGVAAGGLVGLAFARVIGSYIGELQRPGTLPVIISAAIILVGAAIASALPAARAARVDAMQAIRSE